MTKRIVSSARRAVLPRTTEARSWLSRRARIEAPLKVHTGAARRTQVSKMEMAMTKSVVAPFVAAIVGMIQPVHAQVTLDVAKVTCDQWAGYKITNPQNIALWVSGYFNGARGNTVLDTQRLTL